MTQFGRSIAIGPLAFCFSALSLFSACTSPDSAEQAAAPIKVPEASNGGGAAVEHSAFDQQICGSDFRPIDLDHIVKLRRSDTSFEANGAGLALGDLNDDGLLDIVLGNLDGPIQVLWNQSNFEFSYQKIGSGRARSVQLIDYDVDGDLDIVIGSGNTPPLIYLNDGSDAQSGTDGNSFSVVTMPGITAPTYAMQWFDPDGDGDLDAVLAAYDMEFGRVLGGEYVNDGTHGVWYVEQTTDGWEQTQLADVAHALAVTTVDINDDGSDEVLIGNDYGVPDAIWSWSDGRWIDATDLLPVTAANTMSFDVGDINNDGSEELYATDMMPFDESNDDFWSQMAGADHDPPGPQLVENVLIDLAKGDNLAPELGVEATGWSWSGRLLDLDNDRDLDLYVANGMLPTAMYTVFPDGELEEPNLAYRNNSQSNSSQSDDAIDPDSTDLFTRADEWGLASLASTRGIAAADLDNDGDLDIVTTTVDKPAQVFVNELCDGRSVVVKPVSVTNRHTFGAEVSVSSGGIVQTRTIRSGIGYLSADPAMAHIGIGDADIDWVAIDWPDGERTVIDQPDPGLLTVTRSPTG